MILSSCDECGQKSKGTAGIQHSPTCSAMLFVPKLHLGMQHPGITLHFDTPEEQAAFTKKLKASNGSIGSQANTKPKSELAQPAQSANSNNELRAKISDVLGLERAPDGTPEQLLTYNQDGEGIEGSDFTGEVDLLLALFATEKAKLQQAVLGCLPEVLENLVIHTANEYGGFEGFDDDDSRDGINKATAAITKVFEGGQR